MKTFKDFQLCTIDCESITGGTDTYKHADCGDQGTYTEWDKDGDIVGVGHDAASLFPVNSNNY